MQSNTEETGKSEPTQDDFASLLAGFRFTVCETAEEAAEALEVRRRVYCCDAGYAIPCPDEYDGRSWILRAEDLATGQCVGTMRLTPRFAGRFECEEYFDLPPQLCGSTGIEISRFAILPEYRKRNALVPAVSFGLFRLCYELALAVGSTYQVVCSKEERVFTYTAMSFQPTGQTAAYEKLNGAEHELLWSDFSRAAEMLPDNVFRVLFLETAFDEVMLPNRRPPLGLVPDTREFQFAVGA